ncbi:hypothetical protein CAC42_5932 [Sphaceloma murrayae]|uniref:ARS-binding protein 2 n=1 Tax=Sphaceloma murrayae TaxID=2082308 RepID=A0A2K1QZL5_9PEZI|nr:hypothetical protein CAC42_5932 [Sphaceloma murrayae]
MDSLEDIPDPTSVPSVSLRIPHSEVGRSMPDRHVTRDSITEAYVQFILFCNPAYPDDVDIATLRETFSTPPTSNKKSFATFDIYVLVRRLHEYDNIRTWQQLAIELGVDPGTGDDGSGSQRVPQYIVRLKRWMKVSHVDAFFQYLMGRNHEYFTDIPPLSDPHPSEGRDGVLPGEDLALRALDPRLRPRRGRKRLEATMEDLPPAQRHTFQTLPDDRRALFGTPISAIPRSAIPVSAIADRFHDPWSSISTHFPSTMGLSATEPRSAFSAFAADPRLDHMPTPTITNRLNKWASAATASTSSHSSGQPMTPHPHMQQQSPLLNHQSPRMRYLSSPRMTEPHQQMKQGISSPSQVRPPRPSPSGAQAAKAAEAATRAASGLGLSALETNFSIPPAPIADQPNSAVSAASTSSRRERQRLQLQVPKHTGGVVRLMTPPAPSMRQGPSSAGEESESVTRAEAGAIGSDGRVSDTIEAAGRSATIVDQDDIRRILEGLKRSLAADLLRGEMRGRMTKMLGKEAKRLAAAMLERMAIVPGRAAFEDVLSAAIWLGLAHTVHMDHLPGAKMSFASRTAEKKTEIQRFILDDDGYEEPLDDNDENVTTGPGTIRETYNVSWTISTGDLRGEMKLKGLTIEPPP